jgi:DNA invertase Pin-like site-specific DNA recombinase
MRAALYARVSTEDQAKDGFSIAAQVKRLNAYCKARGWIVAGQYIDEGHSGRSIERPAYKSMMSEIDKWDVLIVLKMDRIHRNSINFTFMMNALKDAGKEFNSMQESFDTTTAMGRFVMDIIQRIAQLESEQIGERVKVGMTQKAKKGKGLLGFPAPYGYAWEEHNLIQVSGEAEVVRQIFRDYQDCCTLSQIAARLNFQQVPTKHTARWEKGTVHGILTNRIYTGYSVWDEILQKGKHAQIVDITTYEEVQERLTKCSRKVSGTSGPLTDLPAATTV